MELIVTPAALACILQEWGYAEGERVRVFVRYVSGGEEPFAFGMMRDHPVDPAVSVDLGSLLFYMESKDVWFLEGRSLTIDGSGDEIYYRMA